jgi:predicted nucleotide-binding protein (sugar kinase/HSP70/actin superfamily)
MEELQSLLHAVMERMDMQSASIEQIKTDISDLKKNLNKVEQKVDRIESHVNGMKQMVGIIKEELSSIDRSKERLDQVLMEEENWQEQITQALALCSKEKKNQLKNIIDQHVG